MSCLVSKETQAENSRVTKKSNKVFVTFDEPVFNEESRGGKHVNKIHIDLIFDSKC